MTAAISSGPAGFIPRLTRAWVSVYCTGMTSAARAIRRIEIESDLWEHYADRAASGADPAATGLEAFSRLLRGVPSDIAWRFQAEGFHMNINFPVERIAGVLLLFLLIPFIAGSAISGYDTSLDTWPDEFARFSDIGQRDATALLHATLGLGLVIAASQLLASFQERSPRLVTAGCVLLIAAGTLMLVNAAAYRAMSSLADDFAVSGDTSILAPARSFATVIETLAMANLGASVLGVLCLGTALVRMGMLPRWTIALPAFGVATPFLALSLETVMDDVEWLAIASGMLAVALWLVICGVWLLLGGANVKSMKAVPAHTA